MSTKDKIVKELNKLEDEFKKNYTYGVDVKIIDKILKEFECD
ncbi:hypothetical protein [uncultured Clostridium sp.]|nr:hypothetical protein [uncultured Clostridium sp.]